MHETLTGIGNDDAPLAMLFALLDGSVFRRAQCRRSAKAAAVELKKALRDKDIPDAIKIGLLPILERAGYPIGDDEARAYFRDFKAMVKRRTLELAKALSDAPVSLRRLLSVVVPEKPPSSPLGACLSATYSFFIPQSMAKLMEKCRKPSDKKRKKRTAPPEMWFSKSRRFCPQAQRMTFIRSPSLPSR